METGREGWKRCKRERRETDGEKHSLGHFSVHINALNDFHSSSSVPQFTECASRLKWASQALCNVDSTKEKNEPDIFTLSGLDSIDFLSQSS